MGTHPDHRPPPPTQRTSASAAVPAHSAAPVSQWWWWTHFRRFQSKAQLRPQITAAPAAKAEFSVVVRYPAAAQRIAAIVSVAGAVNGTAEAGTFAFANSASGDLIARADIGNDCYIVDDQTVAKTNGSSTRSIAGKVYDVDADGNTAAKVWEWK